MEQKSSRSDNFTEAEVREITEGVKKYSGVLYGKFSSTVNQSKKNMAWKAILDSVNAVGGKNRKLKPIKTKVKNMKSKTKEIIASNKRERTKTGGGPSKIKELTSAQTVLATLIPDELIQGVDGGIDLGKNRLILCLGSYSIKSVFF